MTRAMRAGEFLPEILVCDECRVVHNVTAGSYLPVGWGQWVLLPSEGMGETVTLCGLHGEHGPKIELKEVA